VRRPRLALAGSIVLAISLSPIGAAITLAAGPTVTVRAGDTLTAIARRTGASIAALVEANRIVDPDRIYVGQQLILPDGARPDGDAVPAPASAPATPGSDEVVHVVQRGESLWTIAVHYGSSVSAIAAANGIADRSFIVTGQRLVVPGARATAPTSSPATPATKPASTTAPATPGGDEVVHVVQRDESLWTIAVHYGSSVSAIAAANGIADRSFIVPGQRLVVPGARATAPTSSPATPATKPAPSGLAAAWAERDAIRRLIVAEATARGVPAEFALAVAWQESGWQSNVVSGAGAIGVMQLLPSTAVWVSEAMLGGATVNLFDARSNIRAGVRLLDYYLDRYGRRDLALAAYYQGMTAVDLHGIYPVSRPYIASILALERLLGG